MASTYVNDLRLNEMATGDQSGSWGTVTNTNLELIGEAFSYGTETIGDADSTLTIADGASDPVRSFFLKITSSADLTTTRIVTIAPNTVSKVWMIENATTGGQIITIKQGSGATINVPNGQVKMISTDGAGSGGAVLDLLVDVDLTGTTTLVNLDVSGTLGVTGVLTATSLDISGDIDVDGTTNLDVVDIDGAVNMATTALVTGVLTTTAQAVFNGGFDGNAKATINTADGLSSDYALIITNGETTAGQNFGLRVRGGSNASDVAFTVETYDNANDLFRMYGNGQASFHDGTAALPSITNIGDLNTGMWFPAADTIAFSEGGVEALRIDSSGNVGIGTSVIQQRLSVSGNQRFYNTAADGVANAVIGQIDGQVRSYGAGVATNNFSSIQFATDPSTWYKGDIRFLTNGSDGTASSPTERLRIDSSGNVGIGTSSPAEKLHVVGTLRLDGDNNGITSGEAVNQLIFKDTDTTTGGGQAMGQIDFVTADADAPGVSARISGVADSSTTGQGRLTLFTGAAGTLSNNITMAAGSVVINEAGADMDFRVESDTLTHALFVQGSSGNVGIGETAPARRLEVKEQNEIAFTGIRVNNPTGNVGSAGIEFQVDATYSKAAIFQKRNHANGGGDLIFVVDSSFDAANWVEGDEKLRITDEGNVLVGKTSDDMSVSGMKIGATTGANITRDSFEVLVINLTGSNGTGINFKKSGTSVGTITLTGSSTAYNTSSDYRLKTDAQPMVGASDRVLALKPVNFEWISTGTRVDGFLAHEAQEIVPEAVTGTKDAMRDEEYEVTAAVEATYDEDGNELTAAVEAVMGTRSVPDYQGIDQSKLVPLLTAALQEALTKIADMEIRLAALEG